MKFAQLFILLLAFFLVKPAEAGLLIEPAVGFSFSKFEPKNAKEYKANGVNLGGRLGYQNMGFQLGLDYLRGSEYIDSSHFSGNYNHSEWAAFAGFEFPVLFRVYAGYIFSAEGDAKHKTDGKVKFSDGSGMKLGVGYTGLPFIDINFEYRSGKYDKTKVGGLSADSTDFSGFMIGLSLPFVI